MKKEIYFALCMAAAMSLAMCSYNVFYIYGGGKMFVVQLLKEWLFEYVLAVGVIFLFVARTAKYVTDVLFGNRMCAFRFKLVMPSVMVGIMVPVMSFFSLAMWNGFNNDFSVLFFKSLMRNYPMAWVCQVLVIGPMVRLLFQTKKHIKAL